MYRELVDVAPMPQFRFGRLLFVLILLLGIFLRTGGLDWGLSHRQPIGPPHHDESHVIYFLTIPWEQFKSEFHEYEIVRPVFLWRVISRPIYALGNYIGFNKDENLVFEYVVPRAVNSVFGIIGLVVIYALGVRLGGIKSGLFSMVLLTVLPGHWYYSQLLKGDLLVATFDSILLLCAIRIYDRGTAFWYVVAGVTAGLGMAAKPSIIIILPIVLLAHIWRAVTYRNLRLIVSRHAIMTLISAVIIFCLLYPYPFIDTARWWKVLTEPTSQSFHMNWDIAPSSFVKTWNDYNEPPRLFMEMVFGESLRRSFPILSILFLGIAVFAARVKKDSAYIFVTLAAVVTYHSLSFTDPLDDRYAMPLAPYIVLFPALLVGNYPFAGPSWRVVAGTLCASVLLVYTAGVTTVMFPLFAFGKDVRVATAEFLEGIAKPGDIVGEFEAGGRQSLPLDRQRITSIRTRTHGEDPHIFLFSEPDYMVVPVEPVNYDHAFRYQLYTPALQEEFKQYVQSFTHIRRFGKEPKFLGRNLPRMLSTPIFDVYKYSGAPLTEPITIAHPFTNLVVSSPTFFLHATRLAAREVTDKLITFTFNISDLSKFRTQELPLRGILLPFLFLDGNTMSLRGDVDIQETDTALYKTTDGRLGLMIPLNHRSLVGQDEFSVSFYITPERRIEIYTSQNGTRFGQAITAPQDFQYLQLGVAVAPGSYSIPEIHLKTLNIQSLIRER